MNAWQPLVIKQFEKNQTNFFESTIISFFQCLVWKFNHFGKNLFWKSLLMMYVALRELLRLSDCLANWWFCLHIEGLTAVQINNWRTTTSLWSITSLTMQANFNLATMNFFQWLEDIYSFRENDRERVFSCYTCYSGNYSDCEMALWTNPFVDRTFRGFKCSPTEQLVEVW